MIYKLYNFKALESGQHESGYNLEMTFCDLSLILWEQVSNYYDLDPLLFDSIQYLYSSAKTADVCFYHFGE